MPLLPNLDSLIPFLITTPVVAVVSLLYIHEHQLRKRSDQRNALIAQETQRKGLELLTAAEGAETKILSESNVLTKQIEQQFQNRLEGILNSANQVSVNAQRNLLAFFEMQKKTAENTQLQSQKSVENRINEMFERLETRLSDFLVKTEQNTTSAIELELKSARQLIEGYKQQQMTLIDENILAMMEQTLNVVLAKKLSLKDQLDLIYEALEKAKAEKFLV